MSEHHTVIDGKIQHVSVSQISSFNPDEDGGCNMKWYLNKVAGKKEKERDFNTLGVLVHSQLEHYLLTGEDVLGRVAGAGRRWLPRPGPDLLVEFGFNGKPRPPPVNGEQVNYFPPEESLVRAADIPLIGFIDLINSRGEYIDENGVTISEPGSVEVNDHKTAKSFAYAKKGADLIKTTQMCGYGIFVANCEPSLEAVRLSHVVYLTEGAPEARKQTALATIADLRSRWYSTVEPIVEKMKSVAGEREEKNVAGNLNACKSYGGCGHRDYCVSFKNQNALKRIKSMGLLKGRTPGSAAPAANGAAVATSPTQTPWIPPPPGVVPTPATPKVVDITAKQCEAGAGYRFSTGIVGMFLSAVQAQGQTLYSFLPVNNGTAGGEAFNVGPDEVCFLVIPKPAPATPPVPAAPQPPAVPPPPMAAVPAPPAGPPAAPSVPAVPLMTRVTTPPPAPGVPTAPAAPTTEKKTRAKRAAQGETPIAAGAPPGLRLFLGCVPVGLPYQTLDAYINTVVGELQTEFDVADIRFAPNADHPLAFERWVGLLAASVREGLPAAGDYVVFRGSTRLVDVVVETLLPFIAPGNVVRAL